MTTQPKPIPAKEAFRILDEALAGVRLPTETVPVRRAAGRILAADQVSRLDLPPFDKSAMDGFAVLDGDERDEYRVLETIAAGQVAKRRLEPGTAARIMTGAPTPEGTGRVIIQENTEFEGDVVRVVRHGKARNVCKKGEDVRAGDKVLEAGTALGAREIASLVACGVTEVEAARRAKIAVVSTGDEIVDSPDAIEPGKIMNANGPMLAELARENGLEVVCELTAPDDLEATREVFRSALDVADVVVASGGVSVGEFDFVLDAISDSGLEVHFSRVAMKPGKPTVFASKGNQLVFGLSGNPVAVYLMFHLFVLRAVRIVSGGVGEPRRCELPLDSDFNRRKKDRRQYVPARLTDDGRVRAVAYHGSGHLAALTETDGFFVVPAGRATVAAGERVVFLPVGRSWR